tara:strand:+ start:346 stop:717 length:372 start_codon:yes stop_codon:yes gene_type:complete
MAVAVYKGISTVNNTFGSIKLNDTDLIKRDLLNHFAIRKGEKLMDGNFGTNIRDLVMEPLTEETKSALVEEVNEVIASDPRVVAESVTIDEYESGIQVEMSLRYSIDNQVENLMVKFDRSDAE